MHFIGSAADFIYTNFSHGRDLDFIYIASGVDGRDLDFIYISFGGKFYLHPPNANKNTNERMNTNWKNREKL